MTVEQELQIGGNQKKDRVEHNHPVLHSHAQQQLPLEIDRVFPLDIDGHHATPLFFYGGELSMSWWGSDLLIVGMQ